MEVSAFRDFLHPRRSCQRRLFSPVRAQKAAARLGLLFAVLLIGTLSPASGNENPGSLSVRPATGDLRLLFTVQGRKIPLRLYVPSTYDSTQAYPVVVALHGGGVDENSYFDRYEQGRIKEVAEAKGVIVICPRRPATTVPEEALWTRAALQEIAGRYRVDPERVYLLGHSAGGTSALYQAAVGAHPLAAVASLAGAGFLHDSWQSQASVQVPIFLGAATGDEIVPLDRMHRTRDRLEAAGAPVTFHETPGSDHNTFVAPLFEKVFDWFLPHRRPGATLGNSAEQGPDN